MPNSLFFRNLGLYAEDGFLDSATCVQVRREMCEVENWKGVIVGKGNEEGVVDENWRKVLCAEVRPETSSLTKARLEAIIPKLQRHFGLPLDGCDGPVFL